MGVWGTSAAWLAAAALALALALWIRSAGGGGSEEEVENVDEDEDEDEEEVVVFGGCGFFFLHGRCPPASITQKRPNHGQVSVHGEPKFIKRQQPYVQ